MEEMTRRELISDAILAFGALALGCERKAPIDSIVFSHLDSETANGYIDRATTVNNGYVLVLGGRWCGHCEEAVQTLTEMDISTIYLRLNPEVYREAYTHARRLFPSLPDRPSAPAMLSTLERRIGTVGIDPKRRLTRDRYGIVPLHVFRGGRQSSTD